MEELSGHNVRKIGASDGDVTQIGNVRVASSAHRPGSRCIRDGRSGGNRESAHRILKCP
jgi:hypothetical protein